MATTSLSPQQIFDNASNYLRSYGNPYGSYPDRGWGWINPNAPGERCAIASFLTDCKTDLEVTTYLKRKVFYMRPGLEYLVNEITRLYDYASDICNDKERLEHHLEKIAREYNLVYSNPTAIKTINQEIKAEQLS